MLLQFEDMFNDRSITDFPIGNLSVNLVDVGGPTTNVSVNKWLSGAVVVGGGGGGNPLPLKDDLSSWRN